MSRLLKRLLHPFVIIFTVLLSIGCSYVLWSLQASIFTGLIIVIAFALSWLMPVLYWGLDKEDQTSFDHVLHFAGYIAMGVISFISVFTFIKDFMLLIAMVTGMDTIVNGFYEHAAFGVCSLSFLTVAAGCLRVYRGPTVKHVEVRLKGLAKEFDGFRIGQISDLHVGTTIKAGYVSNVTKRMNAQKVDLVALTGDFVDGSVADLAMHVAPLARLEPEGQVYFITGNHEYYSGALAWCEHFRVLGFHVLENDYRTIEIGEQKLLVAGVIDPAAKMIDRSLAPDPEGVAARIDADSSLRGVPRIILAHNPKIAARAAKAGYDLQLSGHTHGGQFFPWNFVTRLVHAPHFVGLSREGDMLVYVNAGTGTWGPPVRIGTKPELTVLTLRSV